MNEEYLKTLNKLTLIERNESISRNIMKCVQYHWECIEFANLIEKSFTKTWFMQIFVNMIMISVTGALVRVESSFRIAIKNSPEYK